MPESLDAIKAELAEYAAQLKKNLDSEKPQVYAAVVWAYQDARVRDAIAARLSDGEVLTSSAQIVPDRALRRERVYFNFSPRGRLDTKNPGILVQIDDDTSVAEILNPFDVRADEDLTVANSADTLPLFAARALREVEFDESGERELGVRWTRFVEQPAMARAFASRAIGALGGAFGGTVGGVTVDSLCGGTPTQSDVISQRGRKEDPDQDTRGGYFDGCQA